VHRRILSLALSGFLIIVLINWSCTKLDTTNLGSDLIPVVDNINTFADTLDIQSTQAVFNDSTKLTLYEDYALGKITTDPIMGQTEARLFLQLKPAFYPYYFGAPKDTITAVDSVVLCLNYKGFYGDSTTPLTFTVNEVDKNNHGEWDSLGSFTYPSLRTLSYSPLVGASLVDNPTTISIPSLANVIKINNGKDSVSNQIRIKLSANFALSLIECDSLLGGSFVKDSSFRAFNNGFAVTVTSGNALVYTNLATEKTRLEVHYKRRNGGPIDTTVTSFYYNDGASGSSAPSRGAVANNITRTRNPLPSGDQEIYLQTTPGTYANLVVPELTGYSNRIIHRAEIQVEQIPDNIITDKYFPAPNYIYLDLKDSAVVGDKWKPIYFDLNPGTSYDPDFKTAGLPFFPITYVVDHLYFGSYLRQKADAGMMRGFYNLNITRYIQQLVTKQTPNYQMRLYSPQSVSYPQYVTPPTSPLIQYDNTIAYGRIKIGGGNHPNPNYRMKLRIIYSNIK